MDCDRWREGISAQADGEDPGLDERLIVAHLARCADCRRFRSGLTDIPRTGELRAVHAASDLPRAVSDRLAATDRAAHPLWMRAALAVAGVSIVVLGVPALTVGDAHGSSSHAARHLGAFTVAYGIGLLAVVWRPAKARAFLPVAAVVSCALAITAVFDVASGDVPFVRELRHLIEIASVGLVWLLAPRPPGRLGASVSAPEGIRLVDDERRAG
jgi:predicted anti-sigma-YlaC factor YlaD